MSEDENRQMYTLRSSFTWSAGSEWTYLEPVVSPGDSFQGRFKIENESYCAENSGPVTSGIHFESYFVQSSAKNVETAK